MISRERIGHPSHSGAGNWWVPTPHRRCVEQATEKGLILVTKVLVIISSILREEPSKTGYAREQTSQVCWCWRHYWHATVTLCSSLDPVSCGLLDGIADFDLKVLLGNIRILRHDLSSSCGLCFLDFTLMALLDIVVQRTFLLTSSLGLCSISWILIEVVVALEGLAAAVALQVPKSEGQQTFRTRLYEERTGVFSFIPAGWAALYNIR